MGKTDIAHCYQGQERSRDAVVALGSWAALLLTAACYWAASPGSASVPPQPEDPWLRLLLARASPAAVVVSVALLLPSLLLALHVIPGAKGFARRALNLFHAKRSLAVLLTVLAGLQASLLLGSDGPTPAFEFVTAALVALVALWFFYGRQEVDRRLLLATLLWAVILILSRQTLHLFRGSVDLAHASWRTQVLFLFHAGSFIAAAAAPILWRIPAAHHRLSRLPLLPHSLAFALFVLLTTATLLLWLALHLQLAEPFRVLLLMRTALLCLTIHSFLLSPSLLSSHARPAAASLPDLPAPLHAILGIIVGGCILVIGGKIILNHLEQLNPDGIAYLTIARSYAEGHPVIRGYWSPLISWLDALLIRLGIEPRTGFRLILAGSALAVTYLTWALARQFGLSRLSRLLASASIGVVILGNGGLSLLTPDLLGAAVMSFYFWWISRPQVLDRPVRGGVVAGLVGALGYYAKYYNFVFVPPHLVLTVLLLQGARKQWRSAALLSALGTGTFLAIAFPWLAALYARYGRVTFTTSAEINRAIFGPASTGYSSWDQRLCDQPPDVLFPWEDPDPRDYPAYGWSPLDSPDEMLYQIRLTRHNLWNWAAVMSGSLGPLPLLAWAACALAALIQWNVPRDRLRFGWLFLTIGMYLPGYLLTHALELRFYWTILPLLLTATFMILEALIKPIASFSGGGRAAAALSVGLMVLPAVTFVRWDTLHRDLTTRISPCVRVDSQALAPLLTAPMAGADGQVNYVAYFTRVRTVGVLPPHTTAAEADVQLRSAGVRTFLAWKGSDLVRALTSTFGYALLGSASVCGADYDILRVPE